MVGVLAMVFAAVVPAAVSADPALATSPTAADIPALISQLKSGYDRKSWSAMHTLARLGAPAVPALLAVVQDRTLPALENVRSPARYQAVHRAAVHRATSDRSSARAADGPSRQE